MKDVYVLIFLPQSMVPLCRNLKSNLWTCLPYCMTTTWRMHTRTVLTSCKALCSHNSMLNVFWLMRETGWDAVALNIVIQSSHPRLLSMEGSFLLDFLCIHWLSSSLRRSVNWCPVKEGCGFSMATRDSRWSLAKPTPDGRLGLSGIQDCQSAWGNGLNCIGYRRASAQFCSAIFWYTSS